MGIKVKLKERSTWVGIATVLAGAAAVVGKPELADKASVLVDYGPLLATVIGGFLIGKSDKPR